MSVEQGPTQGGDTEQIIREVRERAAALAVKMAGSVGGSDYGTAEKVVGGLADIVNELHETIKQTGTFILAELGNERHAHRRNHPEVTAAVLKGQSALASASLQLDMAGASLTRVRREVGVLRAADSRAEGKGKGDDVAQRDAVSREFPGSVSDVIDRAPADPGPSRSPVTPPTAPSPRRSV
ncbi:hypothetical protein [Actinomadura atramentaria]|uniref:hypothetical protein n=1 Tax=Actinomadura atramentaria TaxID=1990 RepID=UPI00039E2F35|nr:hypothetical protein [Actinomadura atramentaria]